MPLGVDVVTTHKFISGKADGADGTLVQPSKWNQDHNFGGGTDGQVLVRDSAQVDGANWKGGSGPTTQTFLTGTAATYTTPAGVAEIVIELVGGGGGGGGGNSGGAGGNGGA